MIQLVDDNSVIYIPESNMQNENLNDTMNSSVTGEEQGKNNKLEKPTARVKPFVHRQNGYDKTGPAETHSYVANQEDQDVPMLSRRRYGRRIFKLALQSSCFAIIVVLLLCGFCIFLYKALFGTEIQECRCAVSQTHPDLDDTTVQLITKYVKVGCSLNGEILCKSKCLFKVDHISTVYTHNLCHIQTKQFDYVGYAYYRNCGTEWQQLYRKICCRNRLAYPCPVERDNIVGNIERDKLSFDST